MCHELIRLLSKYIILILSLDNTRCKIYFKIVVTNNTLFVLRVKSLQSNWILNLVVCQECLKPT